MKSRRKLGPRTTDYGLGTGDKRPRTTDYGLRTLRKRLLSWFDVNCRTLPWRKARPNPYHVWLSEIMLQQTQVETVLPYYRKFLRAFPMVSALAAAPVEEVVRQWSGLGYYSRARNLHRAAQIVAEGRRFPQTKAEWLRLPGIGEYTAGAIASIAFGEKVPVVDGNVIRVLTRAFALKGDPKKNPLKKRLWDLAGRLVPSARPGDFNQALMELGALVCLPKEPKCPICPLRKDCRAYLEGKAARFPTPAPRQPMKKIRLQASLIEKEGRFLLAKRNGARHLQSMWEFPQVSPRRLGLKTKSKGVLPPVKHAIMNRSILLRPFCFAYLQGRPRRGKNYVAYQWIRSEELKNYPTSSLNQKILKGILQEGSRRRGGDRKEA
ncbi:MAG: A/G-specific adenine glycosylase [Deltaproteobacteria bacterium]|nr:A/G-specific adenine glycosylase [Deltaproteobacteria bacterium]